MNSTELKNFLVRRKDIIDSFYAECEKDSMVSTEIDLGVLKEAISYATNLINEIINDVEVGIVPESFYTHLQHDIEQSFPKKYHIEFKSIELKLLSFKAIVQQIIDINEFCEIYAFYKILGFAKKNTVLVGANGCGKTSLANLLKKTMDVSDGIVIPAQKLLILPKFSNTPNLDSAKTHFDQYQNDILTDKVTFDAKEMGDFGYGLARQYGSEMVKILGVLLGERQVMINRGAAIIKKGGHVEFKDIKSTLDDVMVIWNELIEHRQLDCDENNTLKIEYQGSSYDAHKMSDGERVIIYHAGRVLLAPKNSLIIVDEPEVHLHKSIANKLWDILETRRKDCTFFYFTHDLDFASSRIAQKGWIKDFQYPNSWKIELLKENIIPEELQLKLVGSRKKILFCEGDSKNSSDRCIFEILFPNYTIQPVESCKSVIAYTKAFNKIPNKNAEAFGIIDRDFRTVEQLEKLKQENVFSYSVAEIENLFLIDDFIKGFAEYKKEFCNIDEIKGKILELFENNIQQQAAFYVTNRINYVFNESHIKNGKTQDEVSNAFSDFVSQIQISDWFTERVKELNQIVEMKDYEKAILTYNNKGLHRIIEKAFGISSYNKKALNYLRESETAKDILRNVFPSEIRT